jgi:signal peptidase I
MIPSVLIGGILSLLLCCAVFLLRKSLYLVTVIGASMRPLFTHGDRVLVFCGYPTNRLRRGQIVVLTTTRYKGYKREPGRQTWYVKRIVALEGETFTTDTAPYPAADARALNAQGDEAGRWSWQIPPGHVFVCGDNREDSIDSRIWGSIPVNQIIGVVLTKLPTTVATRPEQLPRKSIPYELFPISELAPHFRAETLNNETITLEQYHGKALLLFFVANTSLSYQKIPAYLALAETATNYHVAVVFVVDGEREKTQKLTALLPASQTLLFAPRSSNPFFKDYRVVGTPSCCLLDKHHLVRAIGFTKFDTAILLAQLEKTPSDFAQEGLNA